MVRGWIKYLSRVTQLCIVSFLFCFTLRDRNGREQNVWSLLVKLSLLFLFTNIISFEHTGFCFFLFF